MNSTAKAKLVGFRRRVHLALFAGGACEASAVLFALAAAALVTGRLLGWPRPVAQPWWALALLLPCAYGVWRVWRGALPAVTQAAHLDQRLGLSGLLLSAAEAGADAWDDTLARGLRDSRGGVPGLHWPRLLSRVVPAALLLAVVCLLPAPVPASVRTDQSLLRALADVAAAIELARQEGVLPRDRIEELARLAAELQEGAQQGRPPEWADVDELAARLQQERALQQDALAKAAHALRAVQDAARNTGAPSKASDAPDLQAQMQELLQHAAAAGLLDRLPPDLDPSRAARAGDAATLAQLAEALAQAALEQVEAQRGAAGPLGGEPLEDLAELLRGMQGENGGGDAAAGDGPGRGGVTRGPGHATLELNENFDGDTSALQAHKLPPGHVLPRDFKVMQSSRVDPEVAPARNQGAGGEAGSGSGEAAWRRRLSPTHRAVVREFFRGEPGGGK